MKTRIVLTVLLIVLAGWFSRSIGTPVSTVVRNRAVIASVNGGNDSYVAQAVVDNTVTINWSLGVAALGVILIWAGPVKKALTSPDSDQTSSTQ